MAFLDSLIYGVTGSANLANFFTDFSALPTTKPAAAKLEARPEVIGSPSIIKDAMGPTGGQVVQAASGSIYEMKDGKVVGIIQQAETPGTGVLAGASYVEYVMNQNWLAQAASMLGAASGGDILQADKPIATDVTRPPSIAALPVSETELQVQSSVPTNALQQLGTDVILDIAKRMQSTNVSQTGAQLPASMNFVPLVSQMTTPPETYSPWPHVLIIGGALLLFLATSPKSTKSKRRR